MFGGFGGMELVIVLVIVLILFGSRLPSAMGNLGKSIVSFKKGMKDESEAGSESEAVEKKETTH